MSPALAFVATLSRRFRPLARDRRGATAVQFALIATPLLVFLFGIEETARVMWTQSAMSMAVEDAARYSSVNGPTGACTAADTVTNYAAGRTWGLSLPTDDLAATTAACGCQVTWRVTFKPLLLNLNNYVPYNMNLSAKACFPQWS